MTDILKKLIEISVMNLEKRQPNLLKNTEMTTMTEWNLGHHYANELGNYIFWLSNDIDVVKRNYENRRPDIIFHKRQINCLNLLVVEIKIQNSLSYDDILKIKKDWMKSPLNYNYGACISFSRNGDHIGQLFTNKDIIDLDFRNQDCSVSDFDNELKDEIIEIVKTIKHEHDEVETLMKKISDYFKKIV
ncbi:MAG: hypothetical protein P9L89_05395 [Candidatus Celaenobacter polaris]|nr:hypothetical protein [Candidatus Celaenobacter polaris]